MNVQKTANHSKLFTDIEQVLAQELPLLELNFEFGKLLDHQQETSAIAAAAVYMADQHPEMGGFSPRSLRRMRAFYRAYKNQPDTLRKAMNLSWTQNIVVFEADLTNAEREWYIIEACKFGWSKQELTRKIAEKAHLNSAAQEPAASDAPDADTAENAPQPNQADGENANRGIAHKPPEVAGFRLHPSPRDPDSPLVVPCIRFSEFCSLLLDKIAQYAYNRNIKHRRGRLICQSLVR